MTGVWVLWSKQKLKILLTPMDGLRSRVIETTTLAIKTYDDDDDDDRLYLFIVIMNLFSVRLSWLLLPVAKPFAILV